VSSVVLGWRLHLTDPICGVLLLLVRSLLQIGNAVAPPMAAGLGRCLLLAAAKKAPVAEPVIYVSSAVRAAPASCCSSRLVSRPLLAAVCAGLLLLPQSDCM
jgi:hypothetical protein